MYICSRCHREVDYVLGKKNGRHLCKSCYNTLSNKLHKDAHYIRVARYRKKNKDKIAKRAMEFRRNNPEKVKEYYRKGYKNYRTKHLEKMHTQKAMALGLFVENVNWTKIYKRDKGTCQLCSKPVDFMMSLDHVIPFSKGGKHERKNVQLVHKRCNYRKNRYSRKPEYYTS